MTMLRNIWTDLVDKKLWPVAVLLLVALAATPFVLGGGDDAATESAAVPVTPPASSPGIVSDQGGEVTLVEPEAGKKVERAGKARNPFLQHKPKVDKTSEAYKAGQALGKAVVDALTNGSSGGASAPEPTPTTPTAPAGPSEPVAQAKPTKTTFQVDLAFGEIDVTKKYNNVARLTPLPSADDPFFVFLGVSDDGTSATFMITSEAEPSGDGKCAPTRDTCETLTLRPGDTEFFDMQSGTAGMVTYQLDLKKIRKVKVASTARAAVAHARESQAGRDALRSMLADDPDLLDGWTFQPETGLLVDEPAGKASAAKAGTAVARP